MVLFSGAAVAIGLLISALTESQAIAFFITFFVLGALWLFGDLAQASLGGLSGLASLLNYISFQSRLNNFWRGLDRLARRGLFPLGHRALADGGLPGARAPKVGMSHG